MNALTVDVEDWYQLANYRLLHRDVPPSERVVANTNLVLDFLALHDTKATFFVTGSVAEQFPALVARISGEGHEVASHGFAHRPASQGDRRAFAADLERSITVLEDILQERILGHRAAEFELGRSPAWAFEAMAAAGLRYDSSIFSTWHRRYDLPTIPRHPYIVRTPDGPLIEFPLATVRCLGLDLPIAGGGYWRLLPLPLIQRAIRSLERVGEVAVLYIHPHEFDAEWLGLPVEGRSVGQWLKLRFRARKRNWGRGLPMRVKLERLLSTFSFVPLREVLASEQSWQGASVLPTECAPVRPIIRQ